MQDILHSIDSKNTNVIPWLNNLLPHRICDLLSKNLPFYKNALKYNGELYDFCVPQKKQQKNAHFNHFDIKQSIAQTNKN